MRLVVDASVAVKWFLLEEPNLQEAKAVAAAMELAGTRLFAPPHWTLEVMSVLVRLQPELVDDALIAMADVNPKIISSTSALRRAAALSAKYRVHMFDSLYHAVALETGATLVTADVAYYNRAAAEGSIGLLSQFQVPGSP